MKTGETFRKKQLRRKKSVRTLIYVTISLIGLAITFAKLHEHGQMAERERNAVMVVRSVLDGYHFAKSNITDRWWIEVRPEINAETYNTLEQYATRMHKLIGTYKDTTPETRALAERFQKVLTSVWVDGQPRILRKRGSPDEGPYTNSVLVCFVAERDAELQGLFMPIWHSGLGVMTLPTIEIPDPFLVAILYHELGHAKRHNRVDGGPVGPPGSAEYIGEEVEMHELEGKVLNAVSGGKYHQLLDRITQRFASAKGFEGAMAMITRADCQEIDRMFGCTDTQLPSNILMTQAVMEIGFRYCNTHSLGMQKKVEVYRWFDRHIFTEEKRMR